MSTATTSGRRSGKSVRDARIDPVELSRALGQKHPPTPEQAAVISAPLGPTLVVAGAGAGKTETMAARVVWMVANEFVDPDAVLGLTFTRKAAQQLTSRIRARLARLAGSDVVRTLDPSLALRERILSGEPEVSTYHSYAGRLLSEHGLLLPIEPSATLLSETELWQLAHRVVSTWDGDLDTDRSPTSITEAVLALSGQLAEHLVDPDDLRSAHRDLDRLVHTLGPGPKQRGGPSKALLDILDAQHSRIALLPLVERLAETLRREGALDFGSQMSLAARVAAEHEDVGRAERERFRLVLLDEYQDTGHAQRILLSSLFGRGSDRTLALTAVGDPMQSIYGWRGASAANLPRFATDFPQANGAPAPRLELLTSWRNPPEALDLANHITSPLRGVGGSDQEGGSGACGSDQEGGSGACGSGSAGVPVPMLKARPGAVAGDVRLALSATVIDERDWVADRIADEYRRALAEDRLPPTAAVLVRRNADAEPIADALRARGLPVEVVGLGGLLHIPEVADVIAMLRLVADPMAGSAAMRILTGSRWQIGAADLRELSRRTRELGIRPGYGTAGRVDDVAALDAALESSLPGEHSEDAGLADAIADPGPADRYSETGFARISALASEVHSLRDRIGQPLTELVADIERSMGIGIEAQARTPMSAIGVVGREHLDEFAVVVADYADNPSSTVTGFLAFLAAAETVEDGLAPGEIEVAPHRVQVLTVHSAKGLEWEVVAVPHVSKGVFPSSTAASTWLGAMAELPPTLRGDRSVADENGQMSEGVPVLELDDVHNRKDLADAIDRHKDALARRRLAEDRRLFYVALTRTERALFVSGHHWDETSSKPRGPSDFLTEVKTIVDDRSAAGEQIGSVDHWELPPDDGVENPLAAQPHSALWPRDPLGSRRSAVESGAQAVLDQLGDGPDSTDDDRKSDEDEDPENWAADVDALLAEREERSRMTVDVALPQNLSVSQLVDLAADPDALASRLRRPLPFPPNPLARRGTAFHAWIERRFGATRLLDLDELPGSADTGASADIDLETLQQAFLDSDWSLRSPIEVEVPFETSVAGTVLRGRIDAVFADADGGWTVIDWKTGKEPTASEEKSVVMQLAAYRIAWAELMAEQGAESIPLDKVRAAFHYVRSGRTIAPSDLPDARALAALIDGTPVVEFLSGI